MTAVVLYVPNGCKAKLHVVAALWLSICWLYCITTKLCESGPCGLQCVFTKSALCEAAEFAQQACMCLQHPCQGDIYLRHALHARASVLTE